MNKNGIYKLIHERNEQRFINHNAYNIEKLENDRFVPDTISMLCDEFRKYFSSHIQRFQAQETIKIVDIGPAHGAIGTCFFLMVVNEFNLLDKVQLCLIDPVKEVLKDTVNVNFPLENTVAKVSCELYKKKLDSNKLRILYDSFKKTFNKAEIINKKIQDVKVKEFFDISICTFCLHHIHPDHKSKALKVIIDFLKPKGFFAFADEWFGENYYERFLLGHNHTQDPIPFEFPESPEDLISRIKQKISLHKVVYDGNEAFLIAGHKRVPENKEKTGHFPKYQ